MGYVSQKNMGKLAIFLGAIFLFAKVAAHVGPSAFKTLFQSISKFFTGNVTKTVDEGITLSDVTLRNIGQKTKKNTDETFSSGQNEILQEGAQEASSALSDD